MLATLRLRLAAALLLLCAVVPALASAASSSDFTNNWAVLVCTSRFWFNYRHIANTLAMYRTVKRLGIPDSQIILMLADDVACNPRNPFAGTVYSNADRKTDLYGEKIEVDYKGEEVTVETFLRLLSGRLPESTPASKRLMTDSRSNIFVYMTGHGGDEFLKFQDNEEISAFDIADAFGGMWAKKRYNEILFMVDTCQANTLYSKFYSPNILATGSSEKDQNSYSHHADNDIGVAVTDRYTHHVLTFLESINKTSQIPIQNLFDTFSHEIIRSTPGVRSDLFPRPLNETLLTDFFGGVSQVELSPSGGAEAVDGEEGDATWGGEERERGARSTPAPAAPPRRLTRAKRRMHDAPSAGTQVDAAGALSAQSALAALGAVALLHAGGVLLGRKRRRGAGPPEPRIAQEAA
ncbi:glycosylphosphatidylinositol anchor biosynthesis [Rhodotorula kratochvilovae]